MAEGQSVNLLSLAVVVERDAATPKNIGIGVKCRYCTSWCNALASDFSIVMAMLVSRLTTSQECPAFSDSLRIVAQLSAGIVDRKIRRECIFY